MKQKSKKLKDKLKLINESLTKLETNVANIMKNGFTSAYWEGRKEALADLRELIGDLKEFTDGDAASTTTNSAPGSTSGT